MHLDLLDMGGMERDRTVVRVMGLEGQTMRPTDMYNSCTKLKVNKPCYWPK